MTDLTVVSTEAAVACESTDAYIYGDIFVDDTGIVSAHDDVLARTLYLRAVAAFAIAKGYVIAVAGNISAPCKFSLYDKLCFRCPETV